MDSWVFRSWETHPRGLHGAAGALIDSVLTKNLETAQALRNSRGPTALPRHLRQLVGLSRLIKGFTWTDSTPEEPQLLQQAFRGGGCSIGHVAGLSKTWRGVLQDRKWPLVTRSGQKEHVCNRKLVTPRRSRPCLGIFLCAIGPKERGQEGGAHENGTWATLFTIQHLVVCTGHWVDMEAGPGDLMEFVLIEGICHEELVIIRGHSLTKKFFTCNLHGC